MQKKTYSFNFESFYSLLKQKKKKAPESASFTPELVKYVPKKFFE